MGLYDKAKAEYDRARNRGSGSTFGSLGGFFGGRTPKKKDEPNSLEKTQAELLIIEDQAKAAAEAARAAEAKKAEELSILANAPFEEARKKRKRLPGRMQFALSQASREVPSLIEEQSVFNTTKL